MKKHFFKLVATLSLICGVFAFTCCTDYEEDINAINDRLDELTEGQVATMEQQLATLESALNEANGLIEDLQGQLAQGLSDAQTALEDAIADVEGQLNDINSEIDGIKSGYVTIDALNDEIAALEQQITDLKNEHDGDIASIQDQIEALEEEKAALEQTVNDLTSRLVALETYKGQLELELSLLNQQLEEQLALINGTQEDIANLENVVDSLSTVLNEEYLNADQIADKYATIEFVNSAVAELNTALGQLDGRVTLLEGSLETLTDKVDGIDTAIDGINSTIEGLQTSIGTLQNDLKALSEKLDAEIEALKKDIAGINTAIDGINTSIANLTTELGRVDERLAAVEERLPEIEIWIKTVQDTASMAFGDIAALRGALGIYAEAGKLEATIEALQLRDSLLQDYADSLHADMEATIADLEEAFGAKIDELEGRDAELAKQITDVNKALDSTINAKVADLQGQIDDIKAAMVSSDDLRKYLGDELADAIMNGGETLSEVLNQIEQKVTDLETKLTKYIDDEIDSVIEEISDTMDSLANNINGQINDIYSDVEDLANRIQSLVFVPEYNDGKATLAEFEINGVEVSDINVVTATFRVTPAELAQPLIDQQAEQVLVEVIPVLTRTSASETAYIASVENGTLSLAAGKGAGYIDVTIDINTAVAGYGDLAFAMYVAPKEEIEAVVEGETTTEELNTASCVVSQYVMTAKDRTNLNNSYVLYNESEGKYPAQKGFDVPWTNDDRMVYFYGVDGKADNYYELRIHLDGKYMTIAEAADSMRVDPELITPDYSFSTRYYEYTWNGTGEYIENEDLEKVIGIAEVEPYGASGDQLLESTEMQKYTGSYADVTNTFKFRKGTKFANSYYYDFEVLRNQNRYTVTSLPMEINVEDFTQNWSYEFALAHADDAANPTVENDKAIVERLSFEEVNRGGYAIENVAAIDEPSSVKVYEVSNGSEREVYSYPTVKFGWADNAEFGTEKIDYENGDIAVFIENYDFYTTARTYHYVYTWEINDRLTHAVADFTVTFGPKPANMTIDYGQQRDIKFMLPGSNESDVIDLANGYNEAYDRLEAINAGWFDKVQIESALSLNADITFETRRDRDLISTGYTYLSVPDRLGIEGTHIRVSSRDITNVDDKFEFTHVIKTWFGVTFTYTATANVTDPGYELAYIPTNVVNWNSEEDNKYVQLDYNNNNGVYNVEAANLNNYFTVEGTTTGFKGVLKVEFSPLTKDNVMAGIVNVDEVVLPAPLAVTMSDGTLSNVNSQIQWGNYTAREFKLKANLVAYATEEKAASKTGGIILDTKNLAFEMYQLVESFDPKGAGEYVDDMKQQPISVENDYIVINRENSNEDLVINLWDYLKADGRGNESDNFIPYRNASGAQHNSVKYVNANPAMQLYGAELVFAAMPKATSAGAEVVLNGYNSENGTLTYHQESGEIANPIYVEIDVTLNYYLDYNHVDARKTTLKLKIQDAK